MHRSPRLLEMEFVFRPEQGSGNIAIGDNAIIAANAAVVKDVRENEVVGGVPAKTIG